MIEQFRSRVSLVLTSLHYTLSSAHTPTLSQFDRNVSKDAQPSLHGIEMVGLSPMASH